MRQNLRHGIWTFHVASHMQFDSRKIPRTNPAANANVTDDPVEFLQELWVLRLPGFRIPSWPCPWILYRLGIPDSVFRDDVTSVELVLARARAAFARFAASIFGSAAASGLPESRAFCCWATMTLLPSRYRGVSAHRVDSAMGLINQIKDVQLMQKEALGKTIYGV